MEGMIRPVRRSILPGIVLAFTLAGMALPARAVSPARPRGASVTGLRAWSAPSSTRLVMDFTSDVTPVAPDSGEATSLVVSIPTPALGRDPEVPTSLNVSDGTVDSVRLTTSAEGGRLEVWFHERTSFHVFTLAPDEEKPFRLVVDVTRPGAAAEEAARLARIATTKVQTRTAETER